MGEFSTYWYVKKYNLDRRRSYYEVGRIIVKPIGTQKSKRGVITLYEDERGTRYSSRNVFTWDELAPEYKIRAYRDAYQANRADALYRTRNDSELSSQYQDFVDMLKSERDISIMKIERGEVVEAPRAVWE